MSSLADVKAQAEEVLAGAESKAKNIYPIMPIELPPFDGPQNNPFCFPLWSRILYVARPGYAPSDCGAKCGEYVHYSDTRKDEFGLTRFCLSREEAVSLIAQALEHELYQHPSLEGADWKLEAGWR